MRKDLSTKWSIWEWENSSLIARGSSRASTRDAKDWLMKHHQHPELRGAACRPTVPNPPSDASGATKGLSSQGLTACTQAKTGRCKFACTTCPAPASPCSETRLSCKASPVPPSLSAATRTPKNNPEYHIWVLSSQRRSKCWKTLHSSAWAAVLPDGQQPTRLQRWVPPVQVRAAMNKHGAHRLLPPPPRAAASMSNIQADFNLKNITLKRCRFPAVKIKTIWMEWFQIINLGLLWHHY